MINRHRIFNSFASSVLVGAVITIVAGMPSSTFAQDDETVIDKSKIPATADRVAGFVPAGWKIEEQITGDLNGDAKPDYLLKLIEDKPETDKDGSGIDRSRALVVVLQDTGGKLRNAAVADKLLQCTGCGGAFYGVANAPANVKIEKGVIIVDQDHGSREISEVKFRFRFEPSTGKFLLIGFDYSDNDRLDGSSVTESTNYITGLRVVTRGEGKKAKTKRTTVAKTKTYLDQIDGDKFEEGALHRLGLD